MARVSSPRTSAASISRRSAAAVGLTWLAMAGLDFFLHAGVLAPLYDWGSPFLLSPGQAFARIPIGYLSFLVLAVALAWLLPRLGVSDGRRGAAVAGALGAVGWGALLLGLWSISTATPSLLIGWWLGQTAELALGGFVVGSVLDGVRIRGLAGRVAALLVLGAASAVVLQAIGYATAPVLVD
jgi:hypothetical protein